MHQDKKLIPFGEISESFTGLRDKGIYYVDKTGFIPYLISQKRQICVFTRPRRFGKTLMLRTLRTFFEYALDDDGNPVDNRHYFEGLKVMDAGEDVLKHMGQYPVISLSFKDVSGSGYSEVVSMLNDAICSACETHGKLLMASGMLSQAHAELLQQYMDGRACEEDLPKFLKRYTHWLHMLTRRKVVILVDEYDVPLQQAAIYDNRHPGSDLFEQTVKLIGKFVSGGFKSNDYLEFGIISGCMRVAKESIFTGMNNPGVITVLSKTPEEFWGFSEEEVRKMLAYYGIEDKYEMIERWYDGYFYSGRKVFNPWSLLNAIRAMLNDEGEDAIKAYWGLTSGNDIIDDMIERNPEHRTGLARLMNGETMTVPLYENLSYRDLKENPEAIWSFLLYTGYLKSIEKRRTASYNWEALVTIPNLEVRSLMVQSMERWWKNVRIAQFDAHNLVQAFCNGDTDTAGRELRFVLNDSTSVFDYNEVFYHGMLVGLLKNVATVRSNDEYGEGRPDIVAVAQDKGIVLEVKCVTPKALKDAGIKDNDRARINDIMNRKLDEAAKQIHDNAYIEAVLDDEPRAREVVAYGVCFCKTRCVVRAVSAV